MVTSGTSGGGNEVFDYGNTLVAGDGCTQVAPDEAYCGTTSPNPPNYVVYLGDGTDRFRGPGVWGTPPSGFAFEVHGGPGDDTITGSLRDDLLYGEDGNDTIDGNQHNDTIYGGPGNDNLQGGDENDTIDGGPGSDAIAGDCTNAFCAAGSDTITARDGERDTITCGTGVPGGADSVIADRIDVVGSDCASVDLPADPGPSPGPAPGPGPSPGQGPDPGPSPLTMSIKASNSGSLSKLTGKGYSFRLTVSHACAASLKLVVSATSARHSGLGKIAITLLSTHEAVPYAGTFEGTVSADKKYRRQLRKLIRVTARLSLACTSDGHTATASHDITFKR